MDDPALAYLKAHLTVQRMGGPLSHLNALRMMLQEVYGLDAELVVNFVPAKPADTTP